MGRRKKNPQPLPTTIVVPNFERDFELPPGEARASPENWEGYPSPEPSPRPRQKKTVAPPPAAARSSAAFTGGDMRISIPSANVDDDDDDESDEEMGGPTGTGSSPTPSPPDSSRTWGQLDKADAMRLVLPKRALDDPFAAVDPFAAEDPFKAPNATASAARPRVSARPRGVSGIAPPVKNLSTSETVAVGATVSGHSRALRTAIPATATESEKKADPEEGVPWPVLLLRKDQQQPTTTTTPKDNSTSDPFGSPVKASTGDAPFGAFGTFDAFAPEASSTA
eukprot:m.47182 g.47182  ORF g.47182 m.47182 type:complete len:281 (+) comp8830_c0_seq1:242-1084(+)